MNPKTATWVRYTETSPVSSRARRMPDSTSSFRAKRGILLIPIEGPLCRDDEDSSLRWYEWAVVKHNETHGVVRYREAARQARIGTPK